MNGRQRNRKQAGIFDIVNPDNANVPRNAVPQRLENVHQLPGRPIVGADECVPLFPVCQDRSSGRFRDGVGPMNRPVLEGRAIGEQGLAKSRQPSLYRGRAARIRQEREPSCSEPEQMFGGDIPRPAIINPHQVVTAAVRVWHDAAIQQNAWDSRFLQPR